MIGTFFLRLSATGLSFLTSILLARLLGAEEYGVYAYVMALITLLGIPATLGLPNLVLRQVAAYHARSSWPLMRGILQWANKIVVLIVIGLVLVAGLVAWSLASHYDVNAIYTFGIALVFLLPIQALSALRTAALRGLHHVVLGQLPETIVRPGLFIILLLVASYSFDEMFSNSLSVMKLHAAAAALGFLVGAWLLLARLPREVLHSPPKYDTRIWLKSSWAFLLIGGLRVVNNQLAILMLGPLEGVEAVGLYRVAARGAELVAFVLTAVNMALAPTISSLYTSNQMERLQRIVTLSARIILGASLPIALVLIVNSRWLMSTIFGPEFSDGATTLAILCIGQLVSAAMGSVAYLLNMTGHEKDTAKGITFSVMLNVVLNALLIPRYGVEGAAIATAVSIAVMNVLWAIWVSKRLGISATALGKVGASRT